VANPYGDQSNSFRNPAPFNGLGLAGFILSLVGLIATCGLLNPISLLLSLIALLWRPRGFAVAGTIISLVGTAFLVTVGFGIVAGFMGLKEIVSEASGRLQTETAILEAKANIEQYHAENGTYPDGVEGNKLVLGKKDAWGTELRYDSQDKSYVIRSAGPDKQFDTTDDVTSEQPMQTDTSPLDIQFGPDATGDGPVVIPGDTVPVEPPTTDDTTPGETTPPSDDQSENSTTPDTPDDE
jgi:hypothetical protein